MDTAKEIELLEQKLQKAQAKTNLLSDPDYVEWLGEMEAKLEQLHRLLLRQKADQPSVKEALAALDASFMQESAQALIDAITSIPGGLKKLSIWSRPGIPGIRIYFPGEAGFLTVHNDGSVSDKQNGKITFLPSALYPNWKKSVVEGRKAYLSALDRRLQEHTVKRVSLINQLT